MAGSSFFVFVIQSKFLNNHRAYLFQALPAGCFPFGLRHVFTIFLLFVPGKGIKFILKL